MSSAAPITSYAVLGATTALAWTVAAKRAEHKPIALLLSLLFASDLIRRALRTFVLDPARSEAPFHGAARVAAAVDVALSLSWPAALAGAALVVFVRRSARPAAVAWGLAFGGLAAAYPAARGLVLARAYLAAEVAACMATLVCAVIWYRGSTERTNVAQAVLVILLAGEIASLVVWPMGPFDKWQLVRAMNFVTFGVVMLIQGGSLWESRSQ